jgi:hypothetical protein
MAHGSSSSHSSRPSHSRSRSRRSSARSHRGMSAKSLAVYNNPAKTPSRAPSKAASADGMQHAQRMILNSVVVGGVVVVTQLAMEMLLAKVAWSAPWKAATKIGVGLLGGVGLAYALPKTPSVPAGFAVGGVAGGLRDFYDLYLARYLPSTSAGTSSTTTTQTTTQQTTITPPAGQAMLPAGGVPSGYVGYSREACAVPNAA